MCKWLGSCIHPHLTEAQLREEKPETQKRQRITSERTASTEKGEKLKQDSEKLSCNLER